MKDLGLGLGNEGQVLGLGLEFGSVFGLEISRPITVSRTSKNVKLKNRKFIFTSPLASKLVTCAHHCTMLC